MTGGTQLCFSFHWKTVIVLSFTNIPCLKLFDSKLIYLKYDPKRFRADWDVFFNCDIISFFLLASETEKEKKKSILIIVSLILLTFFSQNVMPMKYVCVHKPNPATPVTQ